MGKQMKMTTTTETWRMERQLFLRKRRERTRKRRGREKDRQGKKEG